MKVLKVKDIVNIYQDPITCLKLEGKAILKKQIQELADGYESWFVEFLDEPGNKYSRLVHPDHKEFKNGS